MRFLITGTAGFIGFHLAKRLVAEGHLVAGVDGITPYYDTELKRCRHAILKRSNAFRAHEVMLEDMERLQGVAEEERPEVIIHLAAQAGVRYSIENPRAYVDSNLVGTFNILEVSRALKPKHVLLASTSSVYGSNTKMPFEETDRTDHPMTLYAASKKATELMAHSYAHLFGIPMTAFRFFTVYGPWGRPDMALFKFVDAIIKGRPIDVYGFGQMTRDFTYVDDLVEAIARLIGRIPDVEPAMPVDAPKAPFRVINIGGGQPVALERYIETIERSLGKKAIRNLLPMQPGDVPSTIADASALEALTGYRPSTPVEVGIPIFIEWYRDYFRPDRS